MKRLRVCGFTDREISRAVGFCTETVNRHLQGVPRRKSDRQIAIILAEHNRAEKRKPKEVKHDDLKIFTMPWHKGV
jgi:hypothetical protein